MLFCWWTRRRGQILKMKVWGRKERCRSLSEVLRTWKGHLLRLPRLRNKFFGKWCYIHRSRRRRSQLRVCRRLLRSNIGRVGCLGPRKVVIKNLNGYLAHTFTHSKPHTIKFHTCLHTSMASTSLHGKSHMIQKATVVLVAILVPHSQHSNNYKFGVQVILQIANFIRFKNGFRNTADTICKNVSGIINL